MSTETLGALMHQPSATKLSRLQRLILVELERAYAATEQNMADVEAGGVDMSLGRSLFEVWGVRWKPQQETRADQAAVSRALARLEARGLVLRQNTASGGRRKISGPRGERTTDRARSTQNEPAPYRATHVQLTALGREVAKRLTPEK